MEKPIVSRNRIKEFGDKDDPWALAEVADDVAATLYEPGTPEFIGASIEAWNILEREYVGKKEIPEALAPDQIEDWVVGHSVRAALAARSAQNKWDAVHGKQV